MRATCKFLFALALAAGPVTSGAAVRAAPTFAGKTITIFIGYGVGGSYYDYAQLFSRHLGQHLPGRPSIIVQSEPGAGGVRMLNDAAVAMRKDGTELFIPPDTTVVTQLLQPNGLAYDASKFRYIGTADQENTFWVVRRGPKASIDGMRKYLTFMGGSGKASTGYMIPALAAPLLGLKIKQVEGYETSRDQILAIEKGEIDGTLQAWQVWKMTRPAWFEPGGFGVPVMQIGVSPDPQAPPTPLLRDLVRPRDRALASLFDTIGVIGRGLAAPPGTPDDTVKTLRAAFRSMLVDPGYVADSNGVNLRVLPGTGEKAESAVIAVVNKTDPAVLAKARALTQ
jgi:tripartite-type tricarboxylate transporter receptor subunit TctC